MVNISYPPISKILPRPSLSLIGLLSIFKTLPTLIAYYVEGTVLEVMGQAWIQVVRKTEKCGS